MDNFNELLFATNQMHRESETPSAKHAKVVDQILLEMLEKVNSGSIEVDSEVRRRESVSSAVYFHRV